MSLIEELGVLRRIEGKKVRYLRSESEGVMV